MKILTKEWAKEYDQLRLIHKLREFSIGENDYKKIKEKSRKEFCDRLSQDDELKQLTRNSNLSKALYSAYINRNREILFSLPKEIYNKLIDIKSLVLGYVSTEDKKTLTPYALRIAKKIEKKSKEANRITEEARDNLTEEFVLDSVVGELVFEEYVKENDYYISIGDKVVCIEDYQILEREDFEINEWEENNPLSLWTCLYAGELINIDNSFELHLLMVDGDKYENEKYWNFTLKGKSVKFVKDY